MNNLKKKIAPSLMCCDYLHLEEQLRVFEQCGIDLLHIDVMDGHFVPNIQLGTDFARQIKRATGIPLDYHLMVENPEEMLSYFDAIGENDIVSIHYESTAHVLKVLAEIKSRGAKAFLALNPATPIDCMKNLSGDLDGVLIMTVNPGFAGQRLIPQTLPKIAETRSFLDENGYRDVEIEADGNVSFENARKMSEAGANIFVAGSSGLFQKGSSLKDNILKMRACIENP